MSTLYFVGENFLPGYLNPITGKAYDSQWIFLELVDTDEFYMFNGGNEFIFRLAISKKISDWKYRICDFIEYELSYGKKILISANKDDYNKARLAYKGHSHRDKYLRPGEKRILVHSTSLEAFESIVRDRSLKSWNCLFDEGRNLEESPIGKLLADPVEYRDYIMFTNGGVAGEVVVNSRQKGRITMDIKDHYRPGVRLYFDGALMGANGLLVRDGSHLKVRDSLRLSRYLLWIADSRDMNLNYEEMTPESFSDLADRQFQEKFAIEL